MARFVRQSKYMTLGSCNISPRLPFNNYMAVTSTHTTNSMQHHHAMLHSAHTFFSDHPSIYTCHWCPPSSEHSARLFYVRHLSKWRRWVATAVDTARVPSREL